jgi:hypothetical protein
MKKLFLLFAFLFSMLSVFCQADNFELFRCSTINLSSLMSETGKWHDTTYTQSYLIGYDHNNLIVTFDNNMQQKIYLGNIINKLTDKDSVNNEFTQITYFCRDQNNLNCRLTITTYKNLPNVILKLEYQNMVVVFQTKLIKSANPESKPPIDDKSNNKSNNKFGISSS